MFIKLLLGIEYSMGKKKTIYSYSSVMQYFFQARNAEKQFLSYGGVLTEHLNK